MIARAEYGVSGDGLITIVQPAAKAGPSFRVITPAGAFQGVTAALHNMSLEQGKIYDHIHQWIHTLHLGQAVSFIY